MLRTLNNFGNETLFKSVFINLEQCCLFFAVYAAFTGTRRKYSFLSRMFIYLRDMKFFCEILIAARWKSVMLCSRLSPFMIIYSTK